MLTSFFHKNRWFWGVLALPICIWLAWYISTYLRIQGDAVSSVAVEALSCPRESIKIGSSHQEGDDGPTEFPVEGCGRSVMIICNDYGARRGLVGQYFAFDIMCHLER